MYFPWVYYTVIIPPRVCIQSSMLNVVCTTLLERLLATTLLSSNSFFLQTSCRVGHCARRLTRPTNAVTGWSDRGRVSGPVECAGIYIPHTVVSHNHDSECCGCSWIKEGDGGWHNPPGGGQPGGGQAEHQLHPALRVRAQQPALHSGPTQGNGQ